MNAPARPHGEGAVLLRRLRARGFALESEEEAFRVAPWLRFTPMMQALLFGLSTLTGSAGVLWGMAVVLSVGLVTGHHPFDALYSGVIRPLEKSPELPPCPVRRRMVFLVGVVWCLVTAWAFSRGHRTTGYVLGGLMSASTALLAGTHICLPSLVMGWLTRRGSRVA